MEIMSSGSAIAYAITINGGDKYIIKRVGDEFQVGSPDVRGFNVSFEGDPVSGRLLVSDDKCVRIKMNTVPLYDRRTRFLDNPYLNNIFMNIWECATTQEGICGAPILGSVRVRSEPVRRSRRSAQFVPKSVCLRLAQRRHFSVRGSCRRNGSTPRVTRIFSRLLTSRICGKTFASSARREAGKPCSTQIKPSIDRSSARQPEAKPPRHRAARHHQVERSPASLAASSSGLSKQRLVVWTDVT